MSPPPDQARAGGGGGRASVVPPQKRVAPLVPLRSSESVALAAPHSNKPAAPAAAAPAGDHMRHVSSTSSFVSVAAPEPLPAAGAAAKPPAAAAAAKPITEVSIVKSLHKEPLRDPRADLSDLIVTKGATGGRRESQGSGSVRGFVLPHMRATTPVSTSVPAPQIVVRSGHGYAGGDSGAGDVTADEDIEDDYVSIVSSRRESVATKAMRQSRRPSRLAVGKGGSRIGSLRVRPQSAASLNSVGSANARSIVVSPTASTHHASLSPSALAFSFGDAPSPTG
ncbi:hypothetical protein H4R21_006788, partial [Coemansia helicoidea]